MVPVFGDTMYIYLANNGGILLLLYQHTIFYSTKLYADQIRSSGIASSNAQSAPRKRG